ncbi:MAG: S8 family serine peptidase [Mycobacteriales bacterium]
MSRTPLRVSLAVSSVAALATALAVSVPAVSGVSPAGVTAVLSVSPGFTAASLPAGTRLQGDYRRVGAVVVTLPGASLRQLAAVPGVRGIRHDYTIAVSGDNGTSTGAGVSAPAALGAPAGSVGAGGGVTVAVLDTGVADTEALDRASGRLVSGTDTSGENGNKSRDGHGHGTFMANLIAGGTLAGQQVGVAPAARVVDVKVAAADGSTSLSKVIAGLDWVAKNRDGLGIRVLNLSLSAPRPQGGYARDPLTDAAEAVRNAGIVVAVSSGNTANQLGDPGHDPLLMSVGAADTRQTASVADFSGSGVIAGMNRPDVVAPGVSMLSVLPASSYVATAYPQSATGTGLYRGSGTSEAAAVTSGAVAIFLSGKTGVSPDDVRASFATVAKNLGGSADGAGLIRIPSKVVRWSAEGAGSDSAPAYDPSTSSTSWSSTSWSSQW